MENKIKGTLLLAYYHPVIWDLAFAFSEIFEKVEICVTNDLKDNYGTHQNVIEKSKSKGFDAYLINRAIPGLRTKKYALVGLDGVFQGDKTLIDLCNAENIPYFCINGYPHNINEPSKNILSFSWFLPQNQYRTVYNNEALIKQVDWRDIAEKGKSRNLFYKDPSVVYNPQEKHGLEEKNILVYYPPFRELKRTIFNRKRPSQRDEFSSFIHRFEECNKDCFDVFKKIQPHVPLNNYSSLSQEEVWDKMWNSYGLVHMKHGDCPGISLIESMLLSRVPIVMKSFVLASQNQDLLIDGYSAIICDTVDELIERTKDHKMNIDLPEIGFDLEKTTREHTLMITCSIRQKKKLRTFIENCL